MDSLEDLAHSSKTQGVKRNLKFSFHESTPVFSSNSRKRKSFVQSNSPRKLVEVISSTVSPSVDISSYDSCLSDLYDAHEFKSSTSQNYSLASNYDFSFDAIRVSSPLNKNSDTVKLSSSLEKCSLLDFDTYSKRIKWDFESPKGKRKSSSAPGTPKHSDTENENNVFKKYHSLDFTPKKSHFESKFGFNSPEFKQILYPQLVERKPAIKPKSPQKLSAELKRLTRPAKKRLFCHDFVDRFTKATNHTEIVHKIFSYLNDSDLANVVKVSKLWKNAVYEDSDIHARYKKYNKYMIRSKENLVNNVSGTVNTSLKFNPMLSKIENLEKENYLTPETHSPIKTKWQKCRKLAEKLIPTQVLTKCPMCADPSVLERNIAQCTKHGCQYIWCNRCLSGSKQGPDHFFCKCEKGTTPPRTDKSSLGDISNLESPKNCSFLSDHYYNCSTSFNQTGNTSSGYFSQSDIDKSGLGSSKIAKSALGVANRCFSGERKQVDTERNLNSFHKVAEMCMRQKLHKKSSYEPSSPPKVKMGIVGSEKSKKTLRRLIR